MRKILRAHDDLVTCLTLVDDIETFGSVFLLSSGWDRRIWVWDLTHFLAFSEFNNRDPTEIDESQVSSSDLIENPNIQKPRTRSVQSIQRAAKGNIHDMDYSPHLKFFAYTSSDMCVYVRKFSPNGSEMKLMYKLQANIDSEVYCVRWNFLTNQWITGMENGDIRIWVQSIY